MRHDVSLPSLLVPRTRALTMPALVVRSRDLTVPAIESFFCFITVSPVLAKLPMIQSCYDPYIHHKLESVTPFFSGTLLALPVFAFT